MRINNAKHFYLNILIILGLVLSSLAPLCANKSSAKIFLEICTANGLQVIALDGDAPDDGDSAPDNKPYKKICSYCVASHMARVIPDLPLTLHPQDRREHISIAAYNDDLTSPLQAKRYEARAPPYAA